MNNANAAAIAPSSLPARVILRVNGSNALPLSRNPLENRKGARRWIPIRGAISACGVLSSVSIVHTCEREAVPRRDDRRRAEPCKPRMTLEPPRGSVGRGLDVVHFGMTVAGGSGAGAWSLQFPAASIAAPRNGVGPALLPKAESRILRCAALSGRLLVL